MAVTINKTDGIVLTTIGDGALDATSTNLTLIGRLYRNYGELVNENFVKLLENFANSSAPTSPMIGQLWYNTTTGIMSVYRSSGFISLAILTTSAAQPNLPKQGDLWFDTVDGQLKMFSGQVWIVVSPLYSSSQTKTGVFAETIKDTLNGNHICLVHYQQNSVVAIQSRDTEWTPQVAISGFTSIKPGFNIAAVNNQKFNGTSSNALELGGVAASRYLRNDTNGSIDGGLTLANDGLTIGAFEDLVAYVEANVAYISKTDGDIVFLNNLDPILKLAANRQVLVTDGGETSPSISFMDDTNSGIFRLDENTIGVSVGSTTILEISQGGLFVNGDIQATSFSGTLSANDIVAGNMTIGGLLTTNNFTVQNNTILGTTSANTVTVRAASISIPNNLTFIGGTTSFAGEVFFANNLNSASNTPITIDADLDVTGDTSVTGALSVSGSFNFGSTLIADTSGRLRLNSTVATGYAATGDFSMGSLNGIRSYNSPKMWVAFNGTLAGLAIYDSFHIDLVVRTSQNNYAFGTEFPITSGAMAVVGSNGANLAAIPSVGATSFTITTTSENARMGLVVLSQ